MTIKMKFAFKEDLCSSKSVLFLDRTLEMQSSMIKLISSLQNIEAFRNSPDTIHQCHG